MGSQLLCPRDKQPLAGMEFIHEVRTWRLHECTRCAGVFAEGPAGDELVVSFGQELGVQTGRACSACDEPMRIVEALGVEVDRCPECASTWFDPGELERAMVWHPGSSDRSQTEIMASVIQYFESLMV